MALVSASSSGKPPSTVTLETATERFEAFCGGVSPAGLVIVIAPDGPVGGAKVLGVTRDGATACPFARPAPIKRATVAEAIADSLFISRRLARSMLGPKAAAPPLPAITPLIGQDIPYRTRKGNCSIAELGQKCGQRTSKCRFCGINVTSHDISLALVGRAACRSGRSPNRNLPRSRSARHRRT